MNGEAARAALGICAVKEVLLADRIPLLLRRTGVKSCAKSDGWESLAVEGFGSIMAELTGNGITGRRSQLQISIMLSSGSRKKS